VNWEEFKAEIERLDKTEMPALERAFLQMAAIYQHYQYNLERELAKLPLADEAEREQAEAAAS
jgi:hypothetical protein